MFAFFGKYGGYFFCYVTPLFLRNVREYLYFD